MKRTFSLLLALLMITALFASCRKAEPTASAAPSQAPAASQAPAESSAPEAVDLSLPIVDDGSVTLKIWFALPAEVTSSTSNLADGTNIAWAEAMKRTGINIEFIHPPAPNEAEQFQLMIASQDYPDIFKGMATMYTGGLDKAVEDNVWMRLNELLGKYAPNYMNWVATSETNTKNSKTDVGNMVCVSQVYDRLQPAFLGYAIRQDWLDDLGLARPVTYDEWYNVLTEFKNNKTTNGAAPMEIASGGIPLSNAFAGGYGVHSSYFIQKDGVVSFSAIEDGMREYLAMMSKWYADGLIDKDFVTNGGMGFMPNNKRIAANECGVDAMMYTWAGDYLSRAGVAEQGANFTLTEWPVKEKGTNPPIAFNGDGAGTMGGGAGAMVFSTCENPEATVRFIDFFYSEEGAKLANYGVEGVTYTTNAEGKAIHTDLIAKNPDGLTTTNAQVRYLIHNGFMVFILDREEDVQSETALEYRTLWAPTGKWNIVGNLTYTAEEGAERASIVNDLQTYVQEMVCKFIMGAEKLDDASWNAYVEQVKAMNVDRAVEITQNAYDRYKAR